MIEKRNAIFTDNLTWYIVHKILFIEALNFMNNSMIHSISNSMYTGAGRNSMYRQIHEKLRSYVFTL